MKLLSRLLRDRKGVSMTEVIVAMAMVLIVTGAAITVLIASSRADTVYRNKYRALNGCENAVECLRFAENDESLLESALKKAGFEEIDPEQEGFGAGYVLIHGDEQVKVVKDDNGDENYVVIYYNDDVIYRTKR